MLVIAILLLVNIKRIEKIFLQYKGAKKPVEVNHAHNIAMDLGRALIDKEGVEQYNAVKPKLEQAKRYYLNANNQNVDRIIRTEESQLEPVKLKVVS